MMSRLRSYKGQEEDAHHKCHLAEEEAKLADAAKVEEGVR